MPKLLTAPITAADLSAYLKTSDDFQFELDIFNICLKGGFSAEHGGTYQDPITKKDRQFDIRMRIAKDSCVLKLAIECKNLKTNCPLLVSRVPRRVEESFHEIILSSATHYRNAVMLRTSTGAECYRVKHPDTVFEPNKLVGKSTAQVGKTKETEFVGGDSEVYEKWAQAIGSAFDLVSSAISDFKETSAHKAATVVFPILVVSDGTLWTADYSSEGVLQGNPHPCEECTLFLRKEHDTGLQGVAYTISHLHIFTKSKFDGFLDRVATNEKYWRCIFPTAIADQLAPRGNNSGTR